MQRTGAPSIGQSMEFFRGVLNRSHGTTNRHASGRGASSPQSYRILGTFLHGQFSEYSA